MWWKTGQDWSRLGTGRSMECPRVFHRRRRHSSLGQHSWYWEFTRGLIEVSDHDHFCQSRSIMEPFSKSSRSISLRSQPHGRRLEQYRSHSQIWIFSSFDPAFCLHPCVRQEIYGKFRFPATCWTRQNQLCAERAPLWESHSTYNILRL
jgi:hypothetical protein